MRYIISRLEYYDVDYDSIRDLRVVGIDRDKCSAAYFDRNVNHEARIEIPVRLLFGEDSDIDEYGRKLIDDYDNDRNIPELYYVDSYELNIHQVRGMAFARHMELARKRKDNGNK